MEVLTHEQLAKSIRMEKNGRKQFVNFESFPELLVESHDVTREAVPSDGHSISASGLRIESYSQIYQLP